MKVQELIVDGARKYILLNEEGMPVVPVIKFIKHLDNIGNSYNTQKTYCYALKLYFEYIDLINRDMNSVDVGLLSDFVGWLRYPEINITSLIKDKPKRQPRTINLIVGVIVNFYDFLFRFDLISIDISSKVTRISTYKDPKAFKSFFEHLNKNQVKVRSLLKVKEPKTKIRALNSEEIQIIYNSCTNIRDRLLIKILFETGLRIGEVLSLFIQDFIFDHKDGHRIRLTYRGELENGAKLKTGEREIYISQQLFDLFDDYEYEVLDELNVDSNFVFVKLKGKNKGKPLNYNDVSALFKVIRKKTDINVHPHLFRHTHATIYYDQTKDIKEVQERLGHANIQTTMNLYVHLSKEMVRKNWDMAKDSFLIDMEEK